VKSETLEAFREFYNEFADFQHAYEAGVYVGAGQDGIPLPGTGQDQPPIAFNAGNPLFNNNVADAFRFAINPPNRGQINPVFPDSWSSVQAASCRMPDASVPDRRSACRTRVRS
jgi:hypothetical protein